MDAWAASRTAAGISAGTIRLQRYYLTRLMGLCGDLDHVDLEVIDRFTGNPGWSANTRRSAATSVRSLLRWAVRAGIPVPPPDLLDVPSMKRGNPRPVPTEIVRRALFATTDPDTRLAIMLAAFCGLRRGEIAGLAWHDIATGERAVYVTGKGGHVRRVPYDHPQLVAALAAADTTSPWVFPSWRRPGRPVTADHIGVTVARALGGGWTCHQLRHRFATDTHAATGDLLTTQQLLGHASPATTQIYVQVPEDRLRAAVSGVGSYMTP